ncbi:MAG: hypothetical protein N4A33_10685 [Bacteriovoracaceae bacterium]|jgi:hypothetical protein|nr:hypothetical protein [Bacteriovoracaceae bacterium]
MKKVLFTIINLILATSAFSMSAPPNCSKNTYELRKTGYEYLPGVTALSAFTTTGITVKNILDNRDKKSFQQI